ncbi:hypothetical protein CLOM_g1235 [Closterium sp. NIES-68]|nr:hypothetical protein CLOM_g1235 [Closterium sp. NIES-68]GJP67233.1 hypothetical protein CLOP_g24078 [Closterium sp. NIES-67]
MAPAIKAANRAKFALLGLATIVSLILLRLIASTVPESDGLMSVGVVGEANQVERIGALHKAWQSAYGLDQAPLLLPPNPIALPRHVPPPPHLDDCAARTGVRQGAERAGAVWAAPGGNGSSCCGCSPQPPWVYGPDDSNLAMTRTVQRDIWQSQFPVGSCEGKRLLIAPWPEAPTGEAGEALQQGGVEGQGGEQGGVERGRGGLEGLAFQVHVMGALLGLAVESGRVLVPLAGSFTFANNSACKGVGQLGQWECFFSPIASSDCVKLAQKAVQSGALRCGAKHIRNVALSAEPTVCLHASFDYNELKMQAAVVSKWGTPHLQRPDTLYRPTSPPPTPDNPSLSLPQVRWWRAQATRFLMRWPSLHLCHVTNLIRHVSTSYHLAARLAFFEETQAEIIRDVAGDTAGPEARRNVMKSAQAKEFLGMEMGKGVEKESVAKTSWATKGGRCEVCEKEGGKGEEEGAGGVASGVKKEGMSAEEEKKWREELEKKQRNVLYYVQKNNELVAGVGREPYITRPLVSLIIEGTAGEGNAGGVGEEGAAAGGGGGGVGKEVEGRKLEGSEVEAKEKETTDMGGQGAEGQGAEGQGVGEKGVEEKGGASNGGEVEGSEVLSSHMLQVHQLRLVEPHLDHVWLHTQSQAVIRSASSYHDWTFLHSTNQTAPPSTSLQHTDPAAAPTAPTAAARGLASLLVASQGDCFVGGLKSHWGRLVNELRSTNGRLFNLFIAMDDDEW